MSIRKICKNQNFNTIYLAKSVYLCLHFLGRIIFDSSFTFTSLWAMSMWWRYSMAVPMSCMISDASDGQTWYRCNGTGHNVEIHESSSVRCELWPTSLCEGLVPSGLNATEQLPSLHTETILTKRSELGQRGDSWQTSTVLRCNRGFITKQVIVPHCSIYCSDESSLLSNSRLWWLKQ